jgi:hypothetical protein
MASNVHDNNETPDPELSALLMRIKRYGLAGADIDIITELMSVAHERGVMAERARVARLAEHAHEGVWPGGEPAEVRARADLHLIT